MYYLKRGGWTLMNYYQNATKRKSTRGFKEKAVSQSAITEIKDYFASCKKLVPEINVELTVLDPKTTPNLAGCIGYEDYIIEAPHYILLTSEDTEYCLENAGFIGEDLVLKLTDMGISTCWITISDANKLKGRLRLNDDKIPVAFIAFGYENSVSNVKRLDIVNQSNVTLKKRSSYEAPKLYIEDAILSEDMGIKGDVSTLDHYTDLYQALVAACCAPSFLNRQPYRFIINNGLFMLVALEDKETDENDAYLNLGILMLNFYGVLSERSGVYGKWELNVPEDVLAKVTVPEGGRVVACIRI